MCSCDGFNIPGIPAAADGCTPSLTEALHEQTMPQFADTIRRLRLTMLVPAIRLAIGEMEIDPASSE
jgi:hypothetical protein